MTSLDVRMLAEWLGPEGAVLGLEKSKLTNTELMYLAREMGLQIDPKAPRRQLSIELVMSSVQRIDKPTDYLLKLSYDELRRYFADRMVSGAELIQLLTELGIAPKSKFRGKIHDFAAREMSDLGMFQRVAKGSTRS